MCRFFLPIFTILFYAVRICAQSNGTVTYTAADGMANGNYLSFLQDRQGYLWVGSYNNGISRFDGQHWRKWDSRNGLDNNAVTDLFETPDGDVGIVHANNHISHFHQGKFEKRPYSDSTRVFNDVFSQTLMHYDRLGQILDVDQTSNTYKLNGINLLPEAWKARYEYVVLNSQPEPNLYLLLCWRKSSKTTDLLLTTYGPNPQPKLLYTLPQNWLTTNALLIGNGTIVLSDYGPRHFFRIEHGRMKPFRPPLPPGYFPASQTDGYSYYADPVSHTLLLIWQLQDYVNGKAQYLLADYDLKDLQLRQTVVFSTSFDVGHCFKDRAGTYWVSTNASVMRIFPEHLFISTEVPGMLPSAWSAAQAANGDIWFSSYGFGLARFDGLHMQPPPKTSRFKSYYDNGSLVDTQGNMFFNAENMQTATGAQDGLLKFDGVHYELLTPGTIGFFLTRDHQGRMMRGMMQHGLWILPEGKSGRDSSEWIKIGRSKGLLLNNVLCALEDRRGRYWMGRLSQGLACYDPAQDTVYNWLKADNEHYCGVMSMDMDSHGNLWLGTDNGLYFLPSPSRVDRNFDLPQAMQRVGVDYTGETAIMTLKIYNDHNLIAGNAQGFYLLDLDAFYAQPRQVIIRSFNEKNGNPLGVVEQNGVFITREKQVWLMGDQGALRFDPRLVGRDTVKPSLHIDSLQTDLETFRDLSGRPHLGSGPQRIRVYFHSALNPLLLDNIRFRYRFTGDSTWSALTENPWVEFPRLAPGRYTFEIMADKYGLQSAPERVSFYIAPVWWQNSWTWLAALVMVIAIALFFLNKERKIAGQQIQLEKSKTDMALMSKEKDKLQVQAIVNQLNPHFINNALQWLQVRVDEDEEAVRVVGKLSENIATVFNNSRQKKSFHALQDELKLAENYLYIQKCRFRERLQYDLPAAGDLQDLAAINVPLMIIQIHVENAVEHGIRSKTDGTGRVQISLASDTDYVIITVTDDGVGRVAAAQIGSRGTQNGTRMLKELATIYNRQNRLPIVQQYEDAIFKTPEGKTYGTRVIIRIPKIYQYDL